MIEASCHCGAVKIEVPRPPETVTSCNCSSCRRNGALWAYYPPADVRKSGESKPYISGDRMLELHHCPICGCTTHWESIDRSYTEKMGVNARLMAPEILAAARVRRLDGADTWTYFDED